MESLRPRDPKAIGPYKLVGRLGAGGMGVVYIASKGSETVALKIIRDSIIDDPSQATRFIREIETLKSIDSPHVAKVLDTGAHNERPWFTTEFVNGPDLKSHVTDKGPMPETSWDALAKGLLDGIAAIHAAGVIHRDIKPANIILSESGPKIIDFGIAQVADATSVTSTGAIAGTPAWFSPEQIEGSEISTATDLFSLGSTLVFAATGKSPWGDVEATTKASVYKILLDEPDLSDLSEKQSRIVRPLLNKDPRARSRDGSPPIEIRSEVSSPSGESSFKQLGKLSRSRMLLGSLAVILLATTGGLVLNSFTWPTADDSRVDSAEQLESTQDTTEPLPAIPLGPDFFEGIATGIELTSAQYGDRITFILEGPGASYVRAAEVLLSEIPEDWTGDCESPITLKRVPVGVAYWAGSCKLSLPSSGETVRGTSGVSITFIDNDGESYVHSQARASEIEALPKPTPVPVSLRLQPGNGGQNLIDYGWWSVSGSSVLAKHCEAPAAWEFRKQNPSTYQIQELSGDWVAVGSGSPSRATLGGCETYDTGLTGIIQSDGPVPGYQWFDSISGTAIKQAAAGQSCVPIRSVNLGTNLTVPPYLYTSEVEVCVG